MAYNPHTVTPILVTSIDALKHHQGRGLVPFDGPWIQSLLHGYMGWGGSHLSKGGLMS